MDHLYNSVVRVEELRMTVVEGTPTMEWVQAEDPDDSVADDMLHYLKCRIDLNFLRLGKDILPAPVAGVAADHIGVLFTYAYAPLKAGQRVVAIENAKGKIPVPGTFEIRVNPDEAQDFSDVHHLEMQVVEVAQDLGGQWPDDEPI